MLKNVFIISGLFFSCVIPSGPVPATLTMKIAGGDTISPVGTIKLLFSEPLRDSILTIRIIPGTYHYVAEMNTARTVGAVTIPSPLVGNTRYMLVPDADILSVNGGKLTDSDSVKFMTVFREVEPNNSSGNTDSIRSRICGSIETVNDSDWYAVSKYPGQHVYLQGSGSSSMMVLVDSSGKVMTGSPLLSKDTLVIPDPMNIPLFIVVTSYMRSAGGYYEIGLRK
jgi:hypothetical protein